MKRRGLWSIGIAGCLVVAAACGVRTGLPEIAPDPVARDGGVDATIDQGPDAPPDSPFDVPPCTPIDARESGPCRGLACQVPQCAPGSQTTVSGTVYAPNGVLPLYNVQVFIPNGALEPFPRGVRCGVCGETSGQPITSTNSDPTGRFTLTGVPAGTNIPIVVQLGKWRRQAVIPRVEACTTNVLTDPNITRLPRNQREGSMPHIALTTGSCDNVGCILPKVGIDLDEFGYQADGFAKAVNVYNGHSEPIFGGGTELPATAASNLWGDPDNLKNYDMAIFSCECSEAPDSKGGYGSKAFSVVTDYLNSGGRIFTTDFQYTWYRYSPDPAIGALSPSDLSQDGIGTITGNAPVVGNPVRLDTSFSRGAALATWMKNTFPDDSYATRGEVYADYVFGNIQAVDDTKTLTWGTSPNMSGVQSGPRIFTLDTPLDRDPAARCGRGVHIDAHVDQPGTTKDAVECNGASCYPATCPDAIKADEGLFAFFFFDLASCVTTCQ